MAPVDGLPNRIGVLYSEAYCEARVARERKQAQCRTLGAARWRRK